MNKKVSELTEATEVKAKDIVMIVQGNENKQASVDKVITTKRANVTLSSTVSANTNYTIPLSYKVGNNSLEVFYCDTKIKKRN